MFSRNYFSIYLNEADYENYETTTHKGKFLISFVINIDKNRFVPTISTNRSYSKAGNFGVGKSALHSLEDYVDRTDVPLKQTIY